MLDVVQMETMQAEMEAVMAVRNSVRRVMATDDAAFVVTMGDCVMVLEGMELPCADMTITTVRPSSRSRRALL